jgi:hypothetical protein
MKLKILLVPPATFIRAGIHRKADGIIQQAVEEIESRGHLQAPTVTNSNAAGPAMS